MRLAVWLAAAAAFGAAPKEQPVGLLLNPGGAQLVRAGNELAMAAKPGEVLFSGDRLKTAAGAASFLFCPEKSSVSLDANSDALLEAAAIKVRAGKVGARTPIPSCLLPQVARLNVASQQHYGVTMVRGERPAEDPAGTLQERIAKLDPAQQAAVKGELEPLDKAIAAEADNPAHVVARAAVYEKYDLRPDALREYKAAAAKWKDAVWIKGRVFELEEAIAADASKKAAAAPSKGKTLALLIGISKYQKLPDSQWLQYAHADAETFHKHLLSPRGGGLPEQDAVLLVNEKATTAAIRNAVQTFLKNRAGKEDTVLVFFAAHGIVETAGSKQAFIVSHDSDPQDLAGTALPMADVQALLQDKLASVKRVVAFVDVCRSGTIGTIKSSTVNASVERLAEAEGEIFGLMASRPKEFSYEGPQFGGGHGAFSHALIKGLAGAADKNGDKVVNVTEIIDYVRETVAKGTEDKQHPRDFGTMENTVPLADASKAGIEISRFPILYDSAREPLLLAQAGGAPGLAAPVPAEVRRFRDALETGSLLPGQPGGAFALLAALKTPLSPEAYSIEENRLRVALEDRGQQVLLRYLTGDQIPQTRADFEAGAAYFDAARSLTPESMLLDSRESFCLGRSLLFEKKFAAGADLLERAASLDSEGAHAFNALGIAYLEQARFEPAIQAFRDAIRRAPRWAYPRHNLALAYSETGDYAAAIRAYQEGMRLAPSYSYLPYNLGLLHQRLNRRKDAETAYRRAIALSPDAPEGYNALGALAAGRGRDKEAEPLYRQAISRSADFLPARHNLALLLARREGGAAEARRLLEENLAKSPDHLPSRLALAEIAEGAGDHAAAAEHYRELLRGRPEYSAARVRLSAALLQAGRTDEAAAEARRAAEAQPDNPAAHEALGDAEKQSGRAAEAKASYAEALRRASDAATRKRIRAKSK